MIDCLQRNTSIPEDVLEWSSAEDSGPGPAKVELESERTIVPIVARLCSLRETIRLQQVREDPAIFATAMSIDAELAAWADTLPVSYAYLTKLSGTGPDFLGKHYHTYQSVFHTGIWNLYRTTRIITNTHILHCLFHRSIHTPFHKSKLKEAETIIDEMSSDICATVPFVLSKPKAAANFALMWPLYTVAIHHGTLPETRRWIISRFERIGYQMGIQQAISIAMVLKQQQEIEVWDHMQIGKIVDEEEEKW